MRSFRLDTIALTLVTGLLAACETGPRAPLMSPISAGAGYGYDETVVDEGRFEVRYSGPRQRSWSSRQKRDADVAAARELTYELALLRAAQLAAADGHPAFAVTDRQSDVDIEILHELAYGDPFLATPYHPYGPYGPFNIYSLHMMGYFPPLFRGAWVQAETRLAIDMLDAATEHGFDTAATLERLEAAHPDVFVEW